MYVSLPALLFYLYLCLCPPPPPGESDTGKSLLSSILCDPMRTTSIVQTSKNFAASSLLDPCNTVRQEELSPNLGANLLKTILGGESLHIEKKYESAQELKLRYPIVATSNAPLSKFCSSCIDEMALRNRCIQLKLFVPIFESPPSDKQLNRVRYPPGVKNRPFLLSPGYTLNSLHLYGLCMKYFPSDPVNIPPYDPTEILQNIPPNECTLAVTLSS